MQNRRQGSSRVEAKKVSKTEAKLGQLDQKVVSWS